MKRPPSLFAMEGVLHQFEVLPLLARIDYATGEIADGVLEAAYGVLGITYGVLAFPMVCWELSMGIFFSGRSNGGIS